MTEREEKQRRGEHVREAALAERPVGGATAATGGQDKGSLQDAGVSLIERMTESAPVNVNEERKVHALIEKLHDAFPQVRVAAALDLGKLKDPEALGPLLHALEDSVEQVRAAVACALKALGDPRAIPGLRKHRFDPSPAVRELVKEALKALGDDEGLAKSLGEPLASTPVRPG